MKYMRFLLLAALACSVMPAQSPTDVFEKAPPEVDQALRDRIAIFMAAHISGKFRDAEKVVHEDSQEIYYNAQKSRYVAYEVVRINYSDNFTKATVVTAVEMDWYTARLGKMRVKPPLTTTWKVDNGLWWWYAVPQTEWATPFGIMHPGEDNKVGVPQLPKHTVANVDALYKQVEVSKTDIALSSWQFSEEFVEIHNKMLGEVTLKMDPPDVPPGMQIGLSHDKVPGGGTAKIHFRYQPADRSVKTTRTIKLHVAPTQQVFTFTVTFAVPPEYEKYLQKK